MLSFGVGEQHVVLALSVNGGTVAWKKGWMDGWRGKRDELFQAPVCGYGSVIM